MLFPGTAVGISDNKNNGKASQALRYPKLPEKASHCASLPSFDGISLAQSLLQNQQ